MVLHVVHDRFSMTEHEAAQAVHEVMGWEAASVHTSCELAWRLSSKRFRWQPDAIAALLWNLRDGEGTGTPASGQDHSAEWDALDLSQVTGQRVHTTK